MSRRAPASGQCRPSPRSLCCRPWFLAGLGIAALASVLLVAHDERPRLLPTDTASASASPATQADPLDAPAALREAKLAPRPLVSAFRAATVPPTLIATASIGLDADAKIAREATEVDFMVRHPADAVARAEKIQCLALRFTTLTEILVTWARHQPAAAQERLARLDCLPQIEIAHLQTALSEIAAL